MKPYCLLIVCISILAATRGMAQISNIPGVGNEVMRIKKYENIEGSPYLYDDWKSGTVTDSKGTEFPNVMLKYDAYKDVVEINQEGKVMLLNSILYPRFSLTFTDAGSDKIIKHEFIGGITIPGIGKSYVEILEPGKVMAAKKIEIKFIDEVVNSYGTSGTIKRFQRTEKYYLVRNNEAIEVKLNNKSILSAINDKLPDLERYLVASKMKIKSETDMASLVAYYNAQ